LGAASATPAIRTDLHGGERRIETQERRLRRAVVEGQVLRDEDVARGIDRGRRQLPRQVARVAHDERRAAARETPQQAVAEVAHATGAAIPRRDIDGTVR
jgi:hypothetical protein